MDAPVRGDSEPRPGRIRDLIGRGRAFVRRHVAVRQHRNAYYLMLNPIVGAAAGFFFWLIFARLAGISPSRLGVGYAIVALGTFIGLLAKGGLDTALLRTVPRAGGASSRRLLRTGVLLGAAIALLLASVIATISLLGGGLPDVVPLGWLLVASIGVLLVATWLQDAYFVAKGEARLSFHRNIVFSGARLALPLPILALGLPQAVPLTWALALLASAAAAMLFVGRLPAGTAQEVSDREFLQSALRNVSGSAAEFLPGLLLAPLVLALEGPEAAAYFGIAWTMASLLLLGSAAIGRSALAEMVRGGTSEIAPALRRGAYQHLWTVLPAAALLALLAFPALSIFGADYAREGASVLALLAASSLLVAPTYLYLAFLRARERSMALVVFPILMIAGLALVVPILGQGLGLTGVALAWLLANIPFGFYSGWRLLSLTREVRTNERTTTYGRAPYLE